VADVVDEITRSIGPVAHEGAAGGTFRVKSNGRDIHAVAAKAVDVDAPEVVLTDTADNPAALAQLCGLVDEDGGSTRWERTHQRNCLQETIACLRGYDLDKNFANCDHFLHGCSRGGRSAASPQWM
jgi:hypothetical protein